MESQKAQKPKGGEKMSENKKQNGKQKKNKIKEYILLGIIIFLAIAIAGMIWFITNKNSQNEENKPEIAYTELIKLMNEDKIERVEMTTGSQNIKVKLKDEEKEKTAIVPSIQAFIELVQQKVDENGNSIEVEQKSPPVIKTVMSTFMSLLPTLLIVALFVMMFKMQGLGEKGKVYGVDENKTDVTFDDVAGLDEEKSEMLEIVDFLKNPKKYQKMGAKIPRGILLYGKPGTGKTLIAKAIAGEAGVPFISMSGSEFIEMFAGLGASRVRKLFDKAKKISPCIVFIDEIDAIGARRSSAGGSETENNQTLNQLLVEMDGFESEQTVIVLAATNRPEMLDKALLRPGRFDRQITIAPPDIKGREAILKIHAKNKKFASNVNMEEIAGDTAGFTGAELANVLNESAIIATRHKHEEITKSDLEEAVKKVTVGIEKQSRVMSEKDKRLTAYHEAGHALVSKYLGTQTDVKEISIIPRGMAGGYTMYKTNEDKYYVSKTEMEEKLVALLGGRAAEKVALDDISTGASNDLEVATKIAKDMITIYGMSDNLGPISLKTDEPYELQIFGEHIGDAVGTEIRAMIDTAYERAQTILLNNMDKLHQVAQRLIEKEIISAEEFEEFFRE